MSFKPNKFKKTVVAFLCFFFFSTSIGLVAFTPQKTHAIFGVGDTVIEIGANLANNILTRIQSVYQTGLLNSLYVKEWIADGVVWVAVKELLADKIKEEIIDNIVSSFNGGPAYVTDPFRFIKGLEKEVAEITINDILDGLNLAEIENLFPNSKVSDILTERHTGHVDDRLSEIFTPTLKDVVNADGDFDEFQDGNFYQGGWAGFFSLTQNPKNNPAGSYFLAEQAIAEAQNEREEAMLNELSWGNGYISKRTGAGTISVPGKLMSDQLNEALTSDLRTIETADEVLEGLSLLAGALIGNILGSDGLSDGSYTGVTTSTAPDSEVDPPDPYRGGGDQVTANDILVDIDDAMLSVSSGHLIDLDFDSNNATVMRMQDPNSPDSTITASSVIVPNLNVVVHDYTDHTTGKEYGMELSLSNVTVTNPKFKTLSTSEATDVGEIDNAKVLGQVFINNAYATEAHIIEANLELDVNASNDDDYEQAIFDGTVYEPSNGDSIESLEIDSLDEIVSVGGTAQYWGDTTSIRGGSTPSTDSTMVLNNVVLVDGTFEHEGVTYNISDPSGMVCDTHALLGTDIMCTEQIVSGIQGDDLRINDTREAWAIMNSNMKNIIQDMTVEVDGAFEIYAGTIDNVH